MVRFSTKRPILYNTHVSKLIIGFYVLTTSLALIVLKLGTKTGSPIDYVNHKLHININIYVITGIIFYGISFLTYIYLISRYDLGYIIPLTTAFVYILIFTASFFVFKEVFTVVKILGIVLILGGIILLNLNKQ